MERVSRPVSKVITLTHSTTKMDDLHSADENTRPLDQSVYDSAHSQLYVSDGEEIEPQSPHYIERSVHVDSHTHNGNGSGTAEGLANELAGYKRRVNLSVHEQHKNAETIAELQNKLLSYRRRVSELEARLSADFSASPGKVRRGLNFGNLEDTDGYMWDGIPDATSTPMKASRPMRDSLHPSSFAESELVTKIEELEEEKMRNSDLKRMHQRIRDELEAASQANSSLIQDLQRLNTEKDQAMTILASEKKKWSNYDVVLREHLSKEHKRLLDLWAAMQHLKRDVADAKSSTRKDLETLQTDMHKATKNTVTACQKFGLSQLTKMMHGDVNSNTDLMAAASSGSLESVLAESLRRLNDTQRDGLNVRTELNSKLHDSNYKNVQLEEELRNNRKILVDLQSKLRRAEQTATDSDAAFWRLRQLSDINTSKDGRDSNDFVDAVHSRRTRSLSPQGAAATRDAAVRSVKRALRSRQEMMHDLEIQMKQSQQQADAAKRQTQMVEERKRTLERQLIDAEETRTQLANEKEDMNKKLERSRLQLKQLQLDKESVEKCRTGLAGDMKQLNHDHQASITRMGELERLRDEAKSNEQRMGEELERLKVDLNGRLDHSNKENNRIKGDILKMKTTLDIQTEDKNSAESRMAETLNMNRRLQETNTKLEDELNDAKMNYKTLAADTDRFKKDLDLAINKTTYMENLLKIAENEKSELTRSKRGFLQENEQLKGNLQTNDRLILELQAAKDAALKETDRYQMNFEQAQKDLDAAKALVAQIETKLRLESQSRRNLEERIFKVQEEHSKFSEIIESITVEKQELIKERTELSDHVNEIKFSFDEENGQVKRLKDELSRLQDINNELQRLLDTAMKEKSSININLEAAMVEIEQLKDSLQLEGDKRRRAEEDVNSTKMLWSSKLVDSEKDWSRKLADLKSIHSTDFELVLNEKESQKSDYERALIELRKKLEDEKLGMESRFKEEMDDLQRQIVMAQNESADKIADIESKYERILSDLRTQLDLLKRQLTDAETDARNSKLRAADADEMMNNSEKRLASAIQDVHFWKSKAEEIDSDLTSQLNRLRTELETSVAELQASETQASSLSSQLNAEIGRSARYKKELEDARALLSSKSSSVNHLQRELDELKSLMQEKEGQLQNASLKSKDYASRINELESNLSTSNFDFDNEVKNSKALQSSCENLEHELKLQKQKFSDLEERANIIKADIDAIRETKEDLESQLRTDHDEMARLESALKSKELMIDQINKDLLDARQRAGDASLDRDTIAAENNALSSQLQLLKGEIERKDEEYKSALDELNLSIQKTENSRIISEKKVIEISTKLEDAEHNSHSSDNNLLAIKAQMQKLINSKKETEDKLSSISSVARRLLLRMRPDTSGVGDLSRMSSGLADNEYNTSAMPLDTSTVEDGRLEEGLASCVSKWDALIRDKTSYQQELDAANRKMREAEQLSINARREIMNLQSTLNDAEEERSALQTRLASSQALLIAQEETLRSRDDDRRQVKAQLTEIEKLMTIKDTKIKNLNDTLEQTQRDFEAISLNERQLRMCEEGWDGERTELEERLRDCEVNLQKERIRYAENEGERESIAHRLSDVESQLRLSETRLHASQSTVDQLRRQVSKSEEDETALRSEMESLSRAVSDNQALQDQLTRANIELQNANTTKTQLRNDLDSTRQQLDDWKSRTADLNGRLVELDRKLNQANESNNEIQLQLNIAQKAIDTRESTISDMRRKMDESDSVRRLAVQKSEEARNKLAVVEKEKHDWQQLKMRWEREISKLSRAVDELSQEKRRTKDAMQHALKEKDSLEKSLTSLEEENRILHNAVQKLQIQVTDLEQGHARRLMHITQQQKTQAESIVEGLRHEKMNLERRLHMQDKAFQDKRRALESEIKDLRDSLKREINRRKDFVTKFSNSSRDIATLHQGLNQSVHHISAISGDQPLLDDLASRANIESTISRLSFQRPLATSSPYISPVKDGLRE